VNRATGWLVKAGARQYDFTNMAVGGFEVVVRAIAASDSLDNIAKVLSGSLEQMNLDAAGGRAHDYHQQVALIVGDRVLTASGYTDAQAIAERDRLERLGLRPIEPYGDGYVIDGGCPKHGRCTGRSLVYQGDRRPRKTD
jgi:hypothetical protein